MAAQPYTARIARRGAGGLQEMIATIVKTTAADTVDFAADFAKVIAASVVADTKGVPAITAVAGVAGTVVTIPAGYLNDDLDLIVIGPALAA